MLTLGREPKPWTLTDLAENNKSERAICETDQRRSQEAPRKAIEKPGRRGDGAGFFFRTLAACRT